MISSTLGVIDTATQQILDRYGFDEQRFLSLQQCVAAGDLSPDGNVIGGRIEPPSDQELLRLPRRGDVEWADTYALGLDALRRGEVAMAVLNGGMATRFGGVVKGIVDALDGRSFLEWKLAEAGRVARAAGTDLPCIVMNSFATDQATRAFLADRRGDLPEPWIISQFVSLRLNRDGSLYCDDRGRVSPYAPGHGDFAEAMRASGTLERLRGLGVRHVMLSNVDNLGARVDPLVVGMHLRSERAMTVEVAAKEPGDAGGSPARVDGRTIVVEGFRFPPDFDQSRIGVFNTNSFVFDLEALDEQYPLTWFYVEKESDGVPVVQLERLVGELSSFIPAAYLQVPRTGPRGRFFPIKAPDDLVASRASLREMLGAPLTE